MRRHAKANRCRDAIIYGKKLEGALEPVHDLDMMPKQGRHTGLEPLSSGLTPAGHMTLICDADASLWIALFNGMTPMRPLSFERL